MIRLLEASTNNKSLVLDPFVGSGTTAVAGKFLNIRVIGVDSEEGFLDIAKHRIEDFQNEKVGKIQ